MSKIFGGSKSKSTQQSTQSSSSSNRAFDLFSNDYSSVGAPAIASGIQGRNEMLDGGFEGYKEKANFNFFRDTGLKNLMGAFGSRGVLQSGAAAKGLQDRGQNMLAALLSDYMGQQQGQAQLGLSLAQLLGGAGQVSTSTGQSTGSSTSKQSNGFGGFLGSFAGGLAASDRRVKQHIRKVGDLDEGLGVYSYHYKDGSGPFIGVMADEVANVIPEALGPVHAGFQTVNYNVIKEHYANA